jgi:hypothetical protein
MKYLLLAILGFALPAFANEGIERGRYYWGVEVESFHPCNSSKAYWVVGEESLLKPLRDQIDKLRTMDKPYPWIFVEVMGEVDSISEREGFAEDYDGLFRLLKVAGVSNVAPKDCPMKANNPVKR